ncbi:MAG: DNA-protecting protein DprA [Granulosicoccus sp.]|nr:DNA-protecting protein DprA [Granulosicoccus sp.]
MDDVQRADAHPHGSPTSAWLTFALAFADSTRLCRHIRNARPEPAAVGALIQRYLDRQDDELHQVLAPLVGTAQMAELFSDATARRRDQALAWQAAEPNRHLLGMDHPAYPTLLQDTQDAPVLLYARGSLDALVYPLLAIVGSRKASRTALAHTREWSTTLASAGLGIVSGLALGIDAEAHEGALAAVAPAHGPTIAIAATPADRIYPTCHAHLAQRIIDNSGLILTEYALGTATRPWFFPQRNRIISGISLGVLVTQAALPSGTLTTATHAIDQGRDVMAVPGCVTDLQFRGCHALIKQGAALVEDARDVYDALGDPLQRALGRLRPHHELLAVPGQAPGHVSTQCVLALDDAELTRQERELLDTLTVRPATLDELMSQDGPGIAQLAAQLGMLEARGLIVFTTGGRYTRC